MKRVGFLYEKLYSPDNIRLAIKKSSKGKHKNRSVRKVLANVDFYVDEIKTMLESGDIKWGKDHYKQVKESSSGKIRNITIPSYYPDQIIHWCLILVIQPFLQKGMIDLCIGSVPTKGGSFGMKKVQKFLTKEGKNKYIYKSDIRHFFENIHVDKMENLLERDFKDKKILSLLHQILMRGSRGTGVGLPIGYYTSQWLSNYYLQSFDHFILEKMNPHRYIRNIDDIVLIDGNKRKLHKIHRCLCEFLKDYSLEIKPNWQVFKRNSRPLDFLGFTFKNGFIRLRKRIFLALSRAIRRFKKQKIKCVHTARSIMSRLGWLMHSSCGVHYYLEYIKPIYSKKYLASLISFEDKQMINS